MKAAPGVQHQLLDLQATDSAIDRLAHRRVTLPELARLAEIEADLRRLADAEVVADTAATDRARAQTKLEGEVDLVRSRADRNRARLASGTGSAKDLANMSSELDSLGRRQATLEDEVLEVMESREVAESERDRVRREAGELADVQAQTQAARDASLAEIDLELGLRRTERDRLAPALPTDLVALYEKIRAGSQGVGAAELRQRRCGGCHLEIGAAEIREIKAAAEDEVLRCENCRRILVRTDESGL